MNTPVKSNYKVKPDDKIIVYDTYLPESSEIIPENIPFKIVYEDDDVMVVDKEAGHGSASREWQSWRHFGECSCLAFETTESRILQKRNLPVSG